MLLVSKFRVLNSPLDLFRVDISRQAHERLPIHPTSKLNVSLIFSGHAGKDSANHKRGVNAFKTIS